jgi:hypothetical protein
MAVDGSNTIRIASKVASVTVDTQAAAYSSGDQIGADLLELTNVALEQDGLAVLESLTVVDKAKQKSALELLFFSSKPTGVANNAVADISDAEMASKFLGAVSIASGDWKDLNANSYASLRNIGLILKSSSATTGRRSVYVLVVAAGTPTYTSTSDLIINAGVTRC